MFRHSSQRVVYYHLRYDIVIWRGDGWHVGRHYEYYVCAMCYICMPIFRLCVKAVFAFLCKSTTDKENFKFLGIFWAEVTSRHFLFFLSPLVFLYPAAIASHLEPCLAQRTRTICGGFIKLDKSNKSRAAEYLHLCRLAILPRTLSSNKFLVLDCTGNKGSTSSQG